MARSLRRYGQISPLLVCLREELAVLIDGFKRLRGARGLKGFSTLSVRRIEADERGAKAAMHGLNRIGRHLGELEEAWLLQALVRQDGLSQVEVAQRPRVPLLGAPQRGDRLVVEGSGRCPPASADAAAADRDPRRGNPSVDPAARTAF